MHVEKGAEAFNFWTHGVSFVAALVGTIFLLIAADSGAEYASFAIYGACTMTLFTASTVHHAVQTGHGEAHSGWLRRFDHISIYLFIAGTYTPITVLAIGGAWGISILSVVWGLAFGGILLKIFAPFTPRWVTVTLYIGLGWIALVAVKPLWTQLPRMGLLLMLLGGIAYTGGAVGYATKKPDLWPKWVGFHGVWHVMVMIGAAFHFFMIGFYVAYW